MTPTLGAPAPLRSTPRRTFSAALVLVLSLLSAWTAANAASPQPLRVAVSGPLPVHPAATSPTTPPPTPPPTETTPTPRPTSQPVTLSAPLGPRISIPILVYHYIRTADPNPRNLLAFDLSISPQLFAQQMDLLHTEGANPITLQMLCAALSGKSGLPPHPVVLTFDDGYADFATAAAPVLERYGFVGTDYVVSGFLGRPGYMTAAQVLQMDEEGLVIGSHTVDHVDLAHAPLTAARAQIVAGKQAMEQLLGHPVLDFAYPYGGFNAAVETMVQQAGFRDAVTTMGGTTQTLAGRFELRRTHVGGAPSLAAFATMADLAAPTPTQLASIEHAPADGPLVVLDTEPIAVRQRRGVG